MVDRHQRRHSYEIRNIFDDLKHRKSILLTLFDLDTNEVLNVAKQAPAPSKDYCQLLLTFRHVIYRVWKITLRGDSESRYPREVRDTYEDFAFDENTQRNCGFSCLLEISWKTNTFR